MTITLGQLNLIQNPPNHGGNRGDAKSDLGYHQDALDDLTKAIELDPNLAVAWHNRGAAKFRLEKYDDAIKDFDQAQKLEPENPYISQFRLEVEIEKLHKTTDKYKGEYRKQMKRELIALRIYLFLYRLTRTVLLLTLFAIIILYFAWMLGILACWGDLACIADVPKEIPDSDWPSTLLSIFLRFSAISLIIVPIVWGIKLLNTGINRAEILKWDLFSRNNVDNSIEYYKNELGNNRNDIIITYMNNWINKNPADRLTALQHKKSANKEQSETETLLQEQLIKHDQKEG